VTAKLRPDATLAFCPPEPAFAAEWAIAHLVDELYWKSHFGFKRRRWRFTPRRHRELHSKLRPRKLAGLVEDGRDLIEAIFAEVGTMFALNKAAVTAAFHGWRRIETALNARLVLAVALLGPARCATVFARMLGRPIHGGRLYPARLGPWRNGKAVKLHFGQPDLLLANDRQLLMIEMKVRGGDAKERYDAWQLLKYLNVAEYAQSCLGLDDVAHLILRPAASPNVFGNDEAWMVRCPRGAGRVAVRVAGLLAVAERNKWRRGAGRDAVRRALEKLVNGVPIHVGSYDETYAAALSSPAPEGPWHTAALEQLATLSADAMPSGRRSARPLARAGTQR
jgi:hypothetical protein